MSRKTGYASLFISMLFLWKLKSFVLNVIISDFEICTLSGLFIGFFWILEDICSDCTGVTVGSCWETVTDFCWVCSGAAIGVGVFLSTICVPVPSCVNVTVIKSGFS